MTESERYEQKALAMIRESATWSCWEWDTRRLSAALDRLEKRGVVRWKALRYPWWRLTIVADKNPVDTGRGNG